MNWNKFTLLGMCSVLAFSGCMTTKPAKVVFDPKAETTIVTGKETTVSPLVGPVRTVFLKAEISPGSTGLYLVVLYLSASGWLSADEVWDSSGTKLEGFRGSDESFEVKYGRVTKEIYYIPLTRQYLEARRTSGLNFRLKGKNGVVSVLQRGSFVGGFLADLDATKKQLAGEVIVKDLIAQRAKGGSRHLNPVRSEQPANRSNAESTSQKPPA